MTGFGRAEAVAEDVRITVEMKGVNHRYADFALRLPRDFWPVEDRIRAVLAQGVARGRVEVHISLSAQESALKAPRVDTFLARAYHNALMQLASSLNLPCQVAVTELAALPGVISMDEQVFDAERHWGAIEAALQEALASMLAMREREGAALQTDMQARLDVLRQLIDEVAERAPLALAEAKERLERRLAEWKIDPALSAGRLEQEVALIAERVDIAEEIVRFRSHLTQLRDALQEAGSVGRKLDFLLQECNREVNTIGSKCQDARIAQSVVALKGELERLREQAQNVE